MLNSKKNRKQLIRLAAVALLAVGAGSVVQSISTSQTQTVQAAKRHKRAKRTKRTKRAKRNIYDLSKYNRYGIKWFPWNRWRLGFVWDPSSYHTKLYNVKTKKLTKISDYNNAIGYGAMTDEHTVVGKINYITGTITIQGTKYYVLTDPSRDTEIAVISQHDWNVATTPNKGTHVISLKNKNAKLPLYRVYSDGTIDKPGLNWTVGKAKGIAYNAIDLGDVHTINGEKYHAITGEHFAYAPWDQLSDEMRDAKRNGNNAEEASGDEVYFVKESDLQKYANNRPKSRTGINRWSGGANGLMDDYGIKHKLVSIDMNHATNSACDYKYVPAYLATCEFNDDVD